MDNLTEVALEALIHRSPARATALARKLVAQLEATRQQLAESQAREAQLRETLGDIANFSHKTYEVLRWANEALSSPTDGSALREAISRAEIATLREAATLCDGIENSYLEDDGSTPNPTDVAVGAGVCSAELKNLAEAREHPPRAETP